MNHSSTDRKTLRFGAVLVGTFIVLMIVTNWMQQREPPPPPRFYYPDPTPYTVHTEINIGSHNCIGWNVNC